MAYDNLSVVTRGGIHTITIKRPSKLNALNRQTLQELYGAVIDSSGEDKVRVIVITGAGDKAFVAGADISEIREQNPTEARTFSEFGQNLMSMIQSLDKPVIAAINGFALGGGMEHIPLGDNATELLFAILHDKSTDLFVVHQTNTFSDGCRWFNGENLIAFVG